LRRKAKASPQDTVVQCDLGIALASLGCTYEAAALLRPLRAQWKAGADAEIAKAALAAQTWWNKNWQTFARLKQAGDREGALTLLGGRAVDYWDLPPLLVHLGDLAIETDHLDLAEHLYRRVFDLAQRGLPNMNMDAFHYVSQSSLVDVCLLRGDAKSALAAHDALKPNPGNAMAHEMQKVRILVANAEYDQAMKFIAKMLLTANNARKGYSKTLRIEFVENSPDLAPLRKRSDWPTLLADPASFGT